MDSPATVRYDKDGSGYIDFDELKESITLDMPEDELERLFRAFDFDDNRKITLNEFLRFYRAVW